MPSRRVVLQVRHHLLGDFVAGPSPLVDHLVVPLLVGDDPALVLADDLFDFLLRLLQHRLLDRRRLQVVGGEAQAGPGRFAEAGLLHPVQQVDRFPPAEYW